VHPVERNQKGSAIMSYDPEGVEATMLDTSVLSEMFGVFDPDQLKEWHIPGFETKSVEVVAPMVRLFYFHRDCTGDDPESYVLRSPKGELGTRFVFNWNLRGGDYLKLRYKLTGIISGGPGSHRIRMPSGKVIKITIFATCA
jgi:hypothetical protein